MREVTVGHRLPEFSAGLRVAERRRRRRYSLLFVFSICVCLFTALTYTLREMKAGIGEGWGGGVRTRGGPQRPPVNP